MPPRKKSINSEQFLAVLHELNLSVYASAKLLGISLRQAQRYGAGEAEIPLTVARLLEMFLRHGIPAGWR